MNNSTISRQTLRADTRKQRNSLSDDFQKQASRLLVDQLKSHSLLCNANNIAIYLANDSELDPSLLIKWCWQHDIKTYLPVIHPFNKGQLLFLHYHAHSEMHVNRYGILEPKLNVNDVLPCSELDIIFTPLVAFTRFGERLGMGGGYYDRTLATWYTKSKQASNNSFINNSFIKPYPIGLAHDCQLVETIPTEHWDVPIPEIITPTKHYQFL